MSKIWRPSSRARHTDRDDLAARLDHNRDHAAPQPALQISRRPDHGVRRHPARLQPVAQKVCLLGPSLLADGRSVPSPSAARCCSFPSPISLATSSPRSTASLPPAAPSGWASSARRCFTSSEPSSSRCLPRLAGRTSRPSPPSSASFRASWPPA